VPELAFIMSDSGARGLITVSPHDEAAHRLAAELRPGSQLEWIVSAASGETAATSDRFSDYETVIGSAPADPIERAVSLDDTCLIMYTSGTTGRPKGAALTHGNLTWNCVNVVVDSDLAGDEVVLVCAPLFHIAALAMTCLPILLKGGTVVLEPAFDPTRMLDLIEERRITFMFGVPAMYNAMAATERWSSADLSSLRLLMCGGAPVPESTISAYLERGLAFVQGYGMTEASPGVMLLDKDQVTAKAGSAGVPQFFTDVRVVRPDGSGAGPGEKGEVIVSGPNVMAGYWQQPDATAEVLIDGWFHSGDVATIDPDGYAFIVDRIKDMIISGGENIYPAEVEDVLYGHPGVAECAVIGVADERWGEVGRAIVVPKPGTAPTEAELLEFCDGKLARYKVPRSVLFADVLPRSGAGKVLKKELRLTYGAPQSPSM
jgi:fatty-acyl-CoA synthase